MERPFQIVKGQRPEDVSGEMAERIKELIWEYSGKTTVPTVIGVLHIVAAELLHEVE